IRIPPRSAPYGRKVLEKQLAREAKGLAKSREGFAEGGEVESYVPDPPTSSSHRDERDPFREMMGFSNPFAGRFGGMGALSQAFGPMSGMALLMGGLGGISELSPGMSFIRDIVRKGSGSK